MQQLVFFGNGFAFILDALLVKSKATRETCPHLSHVKHVFGTDMDAIHFAAVEIVQILTFRWL